MIMEMILFTLKSILKLMFLKLVIMKMIRHLNFILF